MKHCVFFVFLLPRLVCGLQVMCVSRFAVLSEPRFTPIATVACLVTLLTAFVALFVFIPALIGIVESSSTAKAFFLPLFRILWRLFRWVFGHTVNLRLFGCPTQISILQITCIPLSSFHRRGYFHRLLEL